MKKLIAMTSAVALGLGLAACDSATENEVEDTAEQQAELVEEEADAMEDAGQITDEQADAMVEQAEEEADAMEEAAEDGTTTGAAADTTTDTM
jgi:vacuolar-type H+-ATPase subunit H